VRIAVVGAGVGGLAAAVRLARAGHAVTVLEAGAAPGGKCGRVEREGFVWDSGPSLLTMPWVFRDLFAETGPPLDDELELVRVEPVTRYRFADGTGFDLSADLPSALEELETWSPGAGADWTRFLGVCAGMWRAAVPFLTGPPMWPPKPGGARPDPLDFARVRPWWTLSQLARACARDQRLRMVIERFATYAGADRGARRPRWLSRASWSTRSAPGTRAAGCMSWFSRWSGGCRESAASCGSARRWSACSCGTAVRAAWRRTPEQSRPTRSSPMSTPRSCGDGCSASARGGGSARSRAWP